MKKMSQLIIGKGDTNKLRNEISWIVFAVVLIGLIIISFVMFNWIFAAVSFLILAVHVFFKVQKYNENRVIYESFMQLNDSDRQTVMNQARKYIETQSTEFGELTDIGMLDGDFFIRWSDVQSIKVSTRKYTVRSFATDNLPEPGLVTVSGSVELNGKKHGVVHTMVIRPERDMSDEIERFIDFALKHNSRIFVSNDYYFGSA